MATWHCDYTNGNDTTGDGSALTPWKTLQKTIDNATRGDTINVANTSAQVLTGFLTFNTGYNATGDGFLKIIGWDNGGSLTVQRPDEVSARVAGHIDVNGQYSVNGFGIGYVVWENLKIYGGASNSLIGGGEYEMFYGLEITSVSAVPSAMSVGTANIIDNCYIHDITASSGSLIISSTWTTISNNFIDNNSAATAHININTYYYNVYRNKIILNHGQTAILTSSAAAIFENNTFISNGSASAKGISLSSTVYPNHSLVNNIFYNFGGASAKPITFAPNVEICKYGNNAFYDCNANDTPAGIGIDLTGNDISTTGDPFVDSPNDDYSVEGSAAQGAGYGGF